MSQGTAAPAEQPCTKFEWTPGQLTQAVAQFVIALRAALLRFEPTKLLPLLLKHGAKLREKLGEAITEFIAEASLTLLPLFADVFGKGWQVIDDGEALPDDWDPTDFFAGMMLACVHADGETYLIGDELVKRIWALMNGRREFDQHILARLMSHWDDPRIPAWFKEAVEAGGIYIVATGTILLCHDGRRSVLFLYWEGSQLHWSCSLLGNSRWLRSDRGLVPSDSSV